MSGRKGNFFGLIPNYLPLSSSPEHGDTHRTEDGTRGELPAPHDLPVLHQRVVGGMWLRGHHREDASRCDNVGRRRRGQCEVQRGQDHDEDPAAT